MPNITVKDLYWVLNTLKHSHEKDDSFISIDKVLESLRCHGASCVECGEEFRVYQNESPEYDYYCIRCGAEYAEYPFAERKPEHETLSGFFLSWNSPFGNGSRWFKTREELEAKEAWLHSWCKNDDDEDDDDDVEIVERLEVLAAKKI
jgi:DNA-directed RNA polymerase subunit RPC12/RpoP